MQNKLQLYACSYYPSMVITTNIMFWRSQSDMEVSRQKRVPGSINQVIFKVA